MWMKNCWLVAASSSEIGRKILARTVLAVPLVFYRTLEGKAVVMHDQCPHRHMPLSIGTLCDNTIRCGYHGMRIDPKGVCVRIPAQDKIPENARVQIYPLIERYTFAWIWMGDPELANPDLIPDVHWMDVPQWAVSQGYHRVECNYQYMNDNLLDLSHESYVHEQTIGNEAVAESPATTTVTGNQVRVHRDMLNCDAPPFYVGTTGAVGKINRWHTTIFTPPSTNIIENGSYPVESSRDQAMEKRIIHLVTPETESTSHYFWAVARSFRTDDVALTEYIREQTSATFDEDAELLAIQQRLHGNNPKSFFPIALKVDAGPIQARRIVARLLAAEQPEPAGTQTHASVPA
jgi:phenylpropionate dioxygenase-like ring-hydroxylating dioxygenase large terminal subunit